MFTRRFYVCRMFGIPLYVDATFFALPLLLLGLGLWGAVAGAAVLAVSIAAHELGHALTARRYGYRTRDVTLSVLGGCAALEGIPSDPGQELAVALAGPAVSFALSAATFALSVAAAAAHVPTPCAAPLIYASVWNLVLGVFNLLPGFPMDGGRCLRAGLVKWRRMNRVDATWKAVAVGRGFALLLGAFGAAEVVFLGNFGGATSVLIAYFIWKAGEAEYVAVCMGG